MISEFPRSVFSLSQDEFFGQDSKHLPLHLTVKKGMTEEEVDLPEDLHGHVFVIAAAGSVEHNNFNQKKGYILPAKGGLTSLFNGDGILYRIDFHETKYVSKDIKDGIDVQKRKGAAFLASRILKTPDYYLDKSIHKRINGKTNSRAWKNLSFRSFGIARFSVPLGPRNQVNTALLRMRFQAQERLLATWDNGRPFEVNPCTLKLVGPVGMMDQWKPLVKPFRTQPLQPIMTSAHPVFDEETGEMYTVNATKKLLSLIRIHKLLRNGTKQLFKLITTIPPRRLDNSPAGAENSRRNYLLSWPRRFISLLIHSLTLLIATIFLPLLDFFIRKIIRIDKGDDKLYLIKWKGEFSRGSTQVYEIKLPFGKTIHQTVHQIGITRDYIVICDTAFKIIPEHFIPDFASLSVHDWLDEIRHFLTYPQKSETDFYLIKREDISRLDEDISSNHILKATHFKIPREIAHFETDFNNPPNQVVIYAANLCATDPAEYIRKYDESVYDSSRGAKKSDDILYYFLGKFSGVIINYIRKKLNLKIYKGNEQKFRLNQSAGNVCAPTDLNFFGCHVIDATTGKAIRKWDDSVISDENRAWSLAFPAYNIGSKKLDNIYWGAWGLWKDMLTADIYDMYNDYKYRKICIEKVKDSFANKGIPSSISKINVIRDQSIPRIELDEDSYSFPEGYFGTSPTFVPRQNPRSESDGYLVFTVIHSNSYVSGFSIDNHERGWSKNSEIWILDTRNLALGPAYRLSHKLLNFGLTIHTTYLEELGYPSKSNYDIKDDYSNVLELIKSTKSIQENSEVCEAIEKIFHEEIYPNF